ncbi:hypothetical protein [Kitasatospora griseola]|uniref:hypothetical protein n=1 Tax=Kitasatospora griseola TaxID=2064 RepID=UPI0038154048
MNRQGWSYWAAPMPDPEESRTVGYVLDDIGWAQQHGYGWRYRDRAQQDGSADRNTAYHAALPEAEQEPYGLALTGGPNAPLLSARLPSGGTVRVRTGGCEAEAQERLFGDRAAWFAADKTATNLTPLYVPKLLADPRFTEPLAAWSQCMAAAGHPAEDPGEARSELRQRSRSLPADEASAAEVELAVAEARCADRTRLGRIGRELEDEYRNGLGERYSRVLAAYEKLQRTALERAAEIIRRHGDGTPQPR